MTKARPFITAASFLLFVALVALLLGGCGRDDCGFGSGSCIVIDDPQEDFVCRTISVDECFAVQCGYQIEPGHFEVEVNELFCPEDYFYCDEPEAPDTHCVLEGDLCWRGQYLNGAWKYVQVECDIQPTEACDDDEDSDTHEHGKGPDKGKGHGKGRGKGHSK
jgi:hypothetical protein